MSETYCVCIIWLVNAHKKYGVLDVGNGVQTALPFIVSALHSIALHQA